MKLYFPKQNLGCLGIRIGKFYVDFFSQPYYGAFVRGPRYKRWYRLFPFPRKIKEVA